jgi:hypothetical protein
MSKRARVILKLKKYYNEPMSAIAIDGAMEKFKGTASSSDDIAKWLIQQLFMEQILKSELITDDGMDIISDGSVGTDPVNGGKAIS